MFQGKLNPENFGNLKFDVICSIEVLEHINNPTEEYYHDTGNILDVIDEISSLRG